MTTDETRMSPPIPDLKPYFQTYEDLGDGPLKWDHFFGNTHPVEVEIGTGRGMFLVNAGETHPNTNFVGMEIEYTEARHAAKRLQKRSSSNVRILGGDARVGIPKYLSTSGIAAVHVYFPDPWWKRRHWARRIFNDWFVAEAARILIPGGLLHAWTDVEEYFQVMVETVTSNADFLPLPPPEERPAEHDLDYHTSFERKKRQAGFPIYRARWERK